MGLSITVGRTELQIGAASFFKAFFSTVYVRLEGESWGSRFPAVMHDLYSGTVEPGRAPAAAVELRRLRGELLSFPVSDVVWDFENRSARPPWGERISPAITSLANYFVTSDGKDLIDVLLLALQSSAEKQKPLRIS
jgi:2,3-bisphosphoglycerate-dependent phosphoglycerate mutase